MGNTFTRLARGAAFATAVVGVVYSVAFAIVVQRGSEWAQWTAAAALTAGGLVALPVLVAVTSLLSERREAAAPSVGRPRVVPPALGSMPHAGEVVAYGDPSAGGTASGRPTLG